MSRDVLLPAISFIAGLVLGAHIPFLLQPVVLVLWVAVAACLGLHSTRLLLTACGFVMGVLVIVAEINTFDASRLPETLQGSSLSIEGRVVGLVSETRGRQVFSFEPRGRVALDSHHRASWSPRLIRVSYYGSSIHFKPDERWRLQLKVSTPVSLGTLGSFDVERWMFRNSIDAFGTVQRSPQAERLGDARALRRDVVRARLRDRLKTLGQNHESTGMLLALAIGDSSALREQQWDLLRETGTAHLVAISGLHIGLVASFAYALCGFTWRFSVRLQRLLSLSHFRLLGSILAAGAYACLAGFALPTIRAIVMLTVFAIAEASGRFITPSIILGCAMLFVLTVDPLSSLTPGFWLSFGTVSLIIYLCRGRLEQQLKWVQPIRLHFMLAVCLMPVTVWFFQSSSLVSPIANLVAVPWVSFGVVPMLLLATALVAVASPVSNVLVSASLWLLSTLEDMLHLIHSVPLSSSSVAIGSTELVMCCCFGLIVLLAPRGWAFRWTALLILLPVSLSVFYASRDELLELHILDVGQGQAVVMFQHKTVILYDTGGLLGRDTAFESVVLPFLRKSGRADIDHAFISHSDQDHAAGAAALRRHFPDIDIVTSKPQDIAASDAIGCEAGQRWMFDSLKLTVLHPAEHDSGSDNNQSCVVLATFGGSSILLTGDIEAQAERVLASRVGLFPIMVMTAPHHGSATSSSAVLLDTFQPQTVVVSAAKRNAYGFPHSDVQMRYKLAGVTLLETGLHGSVSFRFDSKGLVESPTSFWQERARPWHESYRFGS